MATLERDGAVLHYSEYGSGFPLLALAAGRMRSAAAWWDRAPWNPVENRYRNWPSPTASS
jgi:hypothetical protein